MARVFRGMPLLLLLLVGCGPAGAPAATQSGGRAGSPKSITIGITSSVEAFGNMGGTTTTGGWVSTSEVHSNALVTSDAQTRRPVPRLAEKLPSFNDGTLSILADGQMRVVYTLRRELLWQDGVPVTADDMVFTFRFNGDRGLPNPERTAVSLMSSAEAPDPYTFIIYFKEPYYLANALGTRVFWPQPKHLLGEAYEKYLTTGNADEIINLPYWTSQYVHTGPFKLTAFDPGGEVVFQAFDQYFLGRPKLDIVRMRTFSDEKVLFAALLAGTVDLMMEDSLGAELGFQLKDRWEPAGEGSVAVITTGQRLLDPQWRPAYQMEPANLDSRVRQALYMALDRPALSEGLQAGHGELAASELLSPSSVFYDETKGTFDRYAYNPDRAKALLRDAGWTPGPDGFLHNLSDGRAFKSSITSTGGKNAEESGAIASYWRRVGIDTEERVVPPAFVRDRAYRAQYPGWEVSSAGEGDGIFHKLEWPSATVENRWTGNRDGFENSTMQTLLRRYWTSIRGEDQLQALRAINESWVEQLPILVLFTLANHLATRNGVKALNDHTGGAGGGAPYGTFSRNAHLWDLG